MDTPEKMTTLDTQDTGRRQTKHTQKNHNTTQKTKKMSKHGHNQNLGVNMYTRRISSFCLL